MAPDLPDICKILHIVWINC